MHQIMEMFPAVTTIAQTIQLSLSPVFMLAGIGAILNVLVARLARVVDRARALEMLQPTLVGEDRTHHAWELRLLHWRMKVINTALFLCASSAIATCSVVALLFVGELAHLHIGTVVGVMFIMAMLLLVSGLVMFLIEVRLSLRATYVRNEMLGKRLS
ncbi:uncharacterized protein DUF2721 [Hephaestia caeni]|uniref:Uncharacterized protein DUF2721 n=2 Tax=Hephaestia caeni TaxID=645617 RepID=A0A397NJJ3_9SPHN|nr:uncharacterized protein DUF2721 [Hephaestia caeni]